MAGRDPGRDPGAVVREPGLVSGDLLGVGVAAGGPAVEPDLAVLHEPADPDGQILRAGRGGEHLGQLALDESGGLVASGPGQGAVEHTIPQPGEKVVRPRAEASRAGERERPRRAWPRHGRRILRIERVEEEDLVGLLEEVRLGPALDAPLHEIEPPVDVAPAAAAPGEVASQKRHPRVVERDARLEAGREAEDPPVVGAHRRELGRDVPQRASRRPGGGVEAVEHVALQERQGEPQAVGQEGILVAQLREGRAELRHPGDLLEGVEEEPEVVVERAEAREGRPGLGIGIGAEGLALDQGQRARDGDGLAARGPQEGCARGPPRPVLGGGGPLPIGRGPLRELLINSRQPLPVDPLGLGAPAQHPDDGEQIGEVGLVLADLRGIEDLVEGRVRDQVVLLDVGDAQRLGREAEPGGAGRVGCDHLVANGLPVQLHLLRGQRRAQRRVDLAHALEIPLLHELDRARDEGRVAWVPSGLEPELHRQHRQALGEAGARRVVLGLHHVQLRVLAVEGPHGGAQPGEGDDVVERAGHLRQELPQEQAPVPQGLERHHLGRRRGAPGLLAHHGRHVPHDLGRKPLPVRPASPELAEEPVHLRQVDELRILPGIVAEVLAMGRHHERRGEALGEPGDRAEALPSERLDLDDPPGHARRIGGLPVRGADVAEHVRQHQRGVEGAERGILRGELGLGHLRLRHAARGGELAAQLGPRFGEDHGLEGRRGHEPGVEELARDPPALPSALAHGGHRDLGVAHREQVGLHDGAAVPGKARPLLAHGAEELRPRPDQGLDPAERGGPELPGLEPARPGPHTGLAPGQAVLLGDLSLLAGCQHQGREGHERIHCPGAWVVEREPRAQLEPAGLHVHELGERAIVPPEPPPALVTVLPRDGLETRAPPARRQRLGERPLRREPRHGLPEAPALPEPDQQIPLEHPLAIPVEVRIVVRDLLVEQRQPLGQSPRVAAELIDVVEARHLEQARQRHDRVRPAQRRIEGQRSRLLLDPPLDQRLEGARRDHVPGHEAVGLGQLAAEALPELLDGPALERPRAEVERAEPRRGPGHARPAPPARIDYLRPGARQLGGQRERSDLVAVEIVLHGAGLGGDHPPREEPSAERARAAAPERGLEGLVSQRLDRRWRCRRHQPVDRREPGREVVEELPGRARVAAVAAREVGHVADQLGDHVVARRDVGEASRQRPPEPDQVPEELRLRDPRRARHSLGRDPAIAELAGELVVARGQLREGLRAVHQHQPLEDPAEHRITAIIGVAGAGDLLHQRAIGRGPGQALLGGGAIDRLRHPTRHRLGPHPRGPQRRRRIPGAEGLGIDALQPEQPGEPAIGTAAVPWIREHRSEDLLEKLHDGAQLLRGRDRASRGGGAPHLHGERLLGLEIGPAPLEGRVSVPVELEELPRQGARPLPEDLVDGRVAGGGVPVGVDVVEPPGVRELVARQALVEQEAGHLGEPAGGGEGALAEGAERQVRIQARPALDQRQLLPQVPLDLGASRIAPDGDHPFDPVAQALVPDLLGDAAASRRRDLVPELAHHLPAIRARQLGEGDALAISVWLSEPAQLRPADPRKVTAGDELLLEPQLVAREVPGRHGGRATLGDLRCAPAGLDGAGGLAGGLQHRLHEVSPGLEDHRALAGGQRKELGERQRGEGTEAGQARGRDPAQLAEIGGARAGREGQRGLIGLRAQERLGIDLPVAPADPLDLFVQTPLGLGHAPRRLVDVQKPQGPRQREPLPDLPGDEDGHDGDAEHGGPPVRPARGPGARRRRPGPRPRPGPRACQLQRRCPRPGRKRRRGTGVVTVATARGRARSGRVPPGQVLLRQMKEGEHQRQQRAQAHEERHDPERALEPRQGVQALVDERDRQATADEARQEQRPELLPRQAIPRDALAGPRQPRAPRVEDHGEERREEEPDAVEAEQPDRRPHGHQPQPERGRAPADLDGGAVGGPELVERPAAHVLARAHRRGLPLERPTARELPPRLPELEGMDDEVGEPEQRLHGHRRRPDHELHGEQRRPPPHPPPPAPRALGFPQPPQAQAQWLPVPVEADDGDHRQQLQAHRQPHPRDRRIRPQPQARAQDHEGEEGHVAEHPAEELRHVELRRGEELAHVEERGAQHLDVAGEPANVAGERARGGQELALADLHRPVEEAGDVGDTALHLGGRVGRGRLEAARLRPPLEDPHGPEEPVLEPLEARRAIREQPHPVDLGALAPHDAQNSLAHSPPCAWTSSRITPPTRAAAAAGGRDSSRPSRPHPRGADGPPTSTRSSARRDSRSSQVTSNRLGP